jgi:hypothetical protein
MKQAKTLEEVATALKGRNRTNLYDWIWNHYDELPEYRRYRVDWTRLTAALAKLGLKGRDENKPLSVGLVRMTFLRVMRDKEAEATSTPLSTAAPPQDKPSGRSSNIAAPAASEPPTDYDPSDFNSFVRNR